MSADFLTKAASNPNAYIAYMGELMLANKREGKRWQVTFDLPMDEGTHPFNEYTGKATGKPGTRFKVVLVEINDADEVVNQEHKINAKRSATSIFDQRLGDSLVKKSGILRNDYHFQWFLLDKYSKLDRELKIVFIDTLTYKTVALIKKLQEKAFKVDPKMGVEFARLAIHFFCSVNSCREFKYSKTAADEFKALEAEFVRWAGGMQRKGEL